MEAIRENLPLLATAFRTTLTLSLVSGLLALALGTLVAAMRVSPLGPLRWAGMVYVELLRNTPLTVVFFFMVFVAPRVDIKLPFFVSALTALTVYTAAFICEAIRSGINGVPVGQAEAARSIGMSFAQTLQLVVLPQAIRSVIPPLINVFVALVKNTSIAAGFFVTEMVAASRRLANAYSGDILEVLVTVALLYLLITIPLGLLANRLERKVAFAR